MAKKLTLDIIRITAEDLMLENGETTTLEVKLYLRGLGYIAFQSEISAIMAELCEQNGWSFEYNGLFRIYKLPSIMDNILQYLYSSQN
ncbi:hypothetical protein [Flexithrix dorotheae]|uniref:hypothetical protein n=1 Tax=Flexithrix dorotheae TaxID=70993 RepID=UPI00035DD69B|nr:hypothetical protein [Flexithrix dorotheae]